MSQPYFTILGRFCQNETSSYVVEVTFDTDWLQSLANVRGELGPIAGRSMRYRQT